LQVDSLQSHAVAAWLNFLANTDPLLPQFGEQTITQSAIWCVRHGRGEGLAAWLVLALAALPAFCRYLPCF